MKKQTKVPTSEAALRRAIKKYGDRFIVFLEYDNQGFVVAYDQLPNVPDILWRGRLSDIFKKRSPIRGAKKALRKLLRGKRK